VPFLRVLQIGHPSRPKTRPPGSFSGRASGCYSDPSTPYVGCFSMVNEHVPTTDKSRPVSVAR
jgi:hypothetical protein